ncbi:MAG: hypothetical protein OXS29_03230 [bacterium]|nr:hypothetical protein [bacterium]MDE0288458.1 hypothetical protein [bacterium]MDE0436972.1 hypothetical protein [bacterium]
MTAPLGVHSILPSALKRFAIRDILSALAHPHGVEVDFPREGIMAIGGTTTQGLPIVVLRDMETGKVFHAQKLEAKYQRLFHQTVWPREPKVD